MLGSHLSIAKKSPFQLIHGLARKDYRILAKCMTGISKPPNILVVTERRESIFHWRQLLKNVLSSESYVIYELERQDLGKDLWKPYTSLLVLDQIEDLDHNQKISVENYLYKGGKALCHCSLYLNTDENGFSWNSSPWDEPLSASCYFTTKGGSASVIAVVRKLNQSLVENFSESLCNTSNAKAPVMMVQNHGNGKIVTSGIDFIATYGSLPTEGKSGHNHELSSLLKIVLRELELSCSDEDDSVNKKSTVGFIMGDPKMARQFVVFANQKQEDQRTKYLHFINDTTKEYSFSDDTFTVTFADDSTGEETKQSISFDFKSYWKHLGSCRLGRLLIYADVITSTQEVLSRIIPLLPQPHGFIVVAGYQTKGKGRSGNMWLSPYGCMMFSIAISVPISSALGQKIPFLQHIAAVALVMSVREEPGYEDIGMYIKWPNDIFIGDSIKIGGLIVNSSYSNGCFNAVVGMGINVCNEHPTICLNSVIEEYNARHHTGLKCFSLEQLVAKVITNLELLIQRFERKGHDDFCTIYYKYWLHSNQRVKLHSEDEVVIVKGLDASGFLLVESKSGSFVSLQPDGNSFDMMQGLISVKTRK